MGPDSSEKFARVFQVSMARLAAEPQPESVSDIEGVRGRDNACSGPVIYTFPMSPMSKSKSARSATSTSGMLPHAPFACPYVP